MTAALPAGKHRAGSRRFETSEKHNVVDKVTIIVFDEFRYSDELVLGPGALRLQDYGDGTGAPKNCNSQSSGQVDHCANTGIPVAIAEYRMKHGKRNFAGAVSRCNVLDLPSIT